MARLIHGDPPILGTTLGRGSVSMGISPSYEEGSKCAEEENPPLHMAT